MIAKNIQGARPPAPPLFLRPWPLALGLFDMQAITASRVIQIWRVSRII